MIVLCLGRELLQSGIELAACPANPVTSVNPVVKLVVWPPAVTIGKEKERNSPPLPIFAFSCLSFCAISRRSSSGIFQ
jgi:hypothetical protein